MTAQPRVSVCIPTVNRPELLRDAIASVAAQTWRDFEVVVADNSGDAGCQRRIDAILAEFPGLKFVLHRHPSQVDAIDNFNHLIDHAKGELWACLPDDDRFCPDFLARSVEALDRHPDCAFTFADHWILRLDGTRDEAESAVNTARFGRDLLSEGIYRHADLFPLALRQSICLQTSLFRRPVVASLRFLPGIMAGDHSFFLRLAASRQAIDGYYIRERLFEYRVHGMQITTTTSRGDLLRSQIASYESVKSVPTAYERDFKARLSRCYLALAFLEAEEGRSDEARAHAARSVQLSLEVRNALGALLVHAAPSSVRALRALRTTLGLRSTR